MHYIGIMCQLGQVSLIYTGPEVIIFFMLSSVEHENLNAHKYKLSRNSAFLGSDKTRILFFPLINVKMP